MHDSVAHRPDGPRSRTAAGGTVFDAATLAAAAASGLLVAGLWLMAPAWSASATALLDGAGGAPGPLSWVGRALGKGATAGQVQAIWALIAAANATGSVLLARLCGAERLAWIAGGLWLLISPDALLTVGIEGPLLLTTQTILIAGHMAARAPMAAATTLALALAGVALLSPLGLLAAAPLAVIAALYPRPDGSTAHGVASRPVAAAWIAGVIGAVAVVRLALPGDAAVTWWTSNLSALRVPTPPLLLGGWSELAGIGGLVAVLAVLPAVPLVLAVQSGAARSHGALAAAATWGCVVAFTANTTIVDAGPLITPLVLMATLPNLRRWLIDVRMVQGRTLVVVLAAALLLATWADRTSRPDPRSTLARAVHAIEDPTASRPAVLDAQALALLQEIDAPARVFPDRAGSRGLVEALRRLKVIGGKVREWDAFAARFVLIHHPPVGPVATAWHAKLPTLRCATGACLLAMSDGPQAPARAPAVARPQAGAKPATARPVLSPRRP